MALALPLAAPGLRAAGLHRRGCFTPSRIPARRMATVVKASTEGGAGEDKAKQLAQQLEKSGLTKELAAQVMADWRKQVGHEVTTDDLRKVLTKTSGGFSGLLFVQLLLDAGAAFGALVLGDLLGLESVVQAAAGADSSFWASLPAAATGLLQAVAYILAGYYATGVFFDVFKLTALTIATAKFSADPATFLAAVRDLAGEGSTGLGPLDKGRECINSLKVFQALNSLADILEKERPGKDAPSTLKSLAAYLTLEKAQRMHGYDAAKLGLSDAKAAEIAAVFSAFDKDDNGEISLEEFKKLCAKYAPELSEGEVQAGFDILDTNKDRQIEFNEFVAWWMKKLKLPAGATA